mmetsp:Transcript_2683/g.9499  ORF Transcript_2683/g.9499 Transcript_2683/m.9499 type:complete len:201 (-) Transcript_2683:1302-1904(-)
MGDGLGQPEERQVILVVQHRPHDRVHDRGEAERQHEIQFAEGELVLDEVGDGEILGIGGGHEGGGEAVNELLHAGRVEGVEHAVELVHHLRASHCLGKVLGRDLVLVEQVRSARGRPGARLAVPAVVPVVPLGALHLGDQLLAGAQVGGLCEALALEVVEAVEGNVQYRPLAAVVRRLRKATPERPLRTHFRWLCHQGSR